jgi:hypothetical protein
MGTAGALCALAVAQGWSSKTEVGVIVMFVGFIVAWAGHAGENAWVFGPGWILMLVGLLVIV